MEQAKLGEAAARVDAQQRRAEQLTETEAKAQTQAQRENLVQEPGLLGKIKYNAKKGLYYAQDNAVLVRASLLPLCNPTRSHPTPLFTPPRCHPTRSPS